MTQPSSLIERRLRNANPIADLTSMPAAAWTPEVALSEIERLIADRPAIGQEYEEVQTHRAAARRRGALVGLASFAAVVAFGIVIYLVGGGTEPPVVTTTTPPSTTTSIPPTTTSTTTTSTTPPTTVATTTVPPELFAGVPKLAFGQLEPGPVAAEAGIPVPLAFTVPDVTADFPLGLWVQYPGNPGIGIVPSDAIFPNGFIEYPDPFLIFVMTRSADPIDDVADDIAKELNIGERTETLVADRRAIRLDTAAIPITVPLFSLSAQGATEPDFGIIEGSQHRFYVVEAPTGTLVVWFDIAQEAWETLEPYWQQITDSIEFP